MGREREMHVNAHCLFVFLHACAPTASFRYIYFVALYGSCALSSHCLHKNITRESECAQAEVCEYYFTDSKHTNEKKKKKNTNTE